MKEEKIKEWFKANFWDVRIVKANILEELQSLDSKELHQLFDNEVLRRLFLKECFERKVKEEEIQWRQRSRCQWLKVGGEKH